MPSLFLSPSVQQFNPYVNGLGSEEYYMNLIADAMEPYLYASGISFTRNDPDAPLSQAIALSNAGNQRRRPASRRYFRGKPEGHIPGS